MGPDHDAVIEERDEGADLAEPEHVRQQVTFEKVDMVVVEQGVGLFLDATSPPWCSATSSPTYRSR